jgi:hypothetical protein
MTRGPAAATTMTRMPAGRARFPSAAWPAARPDRVVFHVKQRRRGYTDQFKKNAAGRAYRAAALAARGGAAGQVFIDWKKSSLFFDWRSLSSRNSMASCAPIGLRIRRRM